MKNREAGFIIPLILIIAAAVAIGGTVYVTNKHKQETQSTVQTQDQSTTTTEQSEIIAKTEINTDIKASIEAKTGTIEDLLTLNLQPSKCTFSGSNNTFSSNGIMYISGDLLRADTTTRSKDITLEAHFIKKGDTISSWSGEMGSTASLSVLISLLNKGNAGVTSAQTPSPIPIDLSQKVTYSCTPQPVDVQEFVVPSTVNFVDMNAALHAVGASIR